MHAVSITLQVVALAFGALLILMLNHRINAATRWGFVVLAVAMAVSRVAASGLVGESPPLGAPDVRLVGADLFSFIKCAAFLAGCAGLYDQVRARGVPLP